MQNPLVSIIVPIYKVEPYLRRCLDSIVNQTYTNLEIILVDDGSPDGCPQICDEYAARDKRIVVIHKDNGGLSDARNAGLDICKGEYISFIDSDDWISCEYVNYLLQNLIKNNADISIANSIKIWDNGKTEEEHWPSEVLEKDEALKRILFTPTLPLNSSWGKLYKRFLFEKVRFPKGLIHEDELTSYKYFYHANKISFIDNVLYFYFQRDDSISHEDKKYNRIFIVEKQYFFFKNKLNHFSNELLVYLCWLWIKLYFEPAFPKKISKQHFIYFSKKLKRNKMIPLKRKVAITVFSLLPHTYLLYRKVFLLH